MVTIVGFGSLLSRHSSLVTFPDLQDFRVGRLRGFRRVFAHVTPVHFERCAAPSSAKAPRCLSPH
jgi:hypothetical protein